MAYMSNFIHASYAGLHDVGTLSEFMSATCCLNFLLHLFTFSILQPTNDSEAGRERRISISFGDIPTMIRL